MTTTPVHLLGNSPAKINLFLHITGRREDGYHLLESLFCPVTLSDTIFIKLEQTNDHDLRFIRVGELAALPEESDLTVRAAKAFFKATQLPSKLQITLEVDKHIPTQAGLGGGSSNAATVLKLLQSHYGYPLSAQSLHDIALSLGADVPFFLNSQSAFVEGIGEQITPFSVEPVWLLIYKPPQSCPTSTIFSDTQLTRNESGVKIALFDSGRQVESGKSQLWQFLRTHTRNVMQAVVERKTKGWQQQFSLFEQNCTEFDPLLTRMSGSGSAMFAAFKSQTQLDQAFDGMAAQRESLPGEVFYCQTGSGGAFKKLPKFLGE